MAPTTVMNEAAPSAEVDPNCPSTGPHGNADAYDTYGCRCPSARAAHTRRARRYRADLAAGRPRTVPAVGSLRRVRALIAIGWPRDLIAREAGWARGDALDRLASGRRVYASTAERIHGVYDRLSDRKGPSRFAVQQARRLGYVPPIAWDDDTIDDPDAQPYAEWPADGPDPAVLLRLWARNRPAVVREVDQVAFAREAHARAVPDAEIGKYLGWTATSSGALSKRVRYWRLKHDVGSAAELDRAA